MTKILATFTNAESGLEAYVVDGAYGFHVSMKDLDADQFIAAVLVYKDLDAAIAKAKSIII